MACDATSNSNYPNYLKNILGTIAVGNNNDLKACVCSLRSPVNADGCLALDSNGKVGAFTQCIEPASSPDECPWTLEKAMEMYWLVKTWTFSVSGLEGEGGEPGEIDFYPFSSTISDITSGNEDEGTNYTSAEQLVCGNTPWVRRLDGEIYGFLTFDNPKKSGNLYTSGIVGYMYNQGLVCQFRVYPEYPVDPDADTNNFGTITVLGATLPLFINYFDPEVAITFANVRATLTPTSYWRTFGENLG
jgi:hypothetical protein